MKKVSTSIISLCAAVVFMGVLTLTARPASAQDGILLKVRAGDSNYCHLKFPAIRPETLSWDQPVLQNPNTGTIIDFYGPCDYDPTGKEAVEAQKLAQQRQYWRNQE